RSKWVKRVHTAYVNLGRAQAGQGVDLRTAEREIQNLWSEDQYLIGLAYVKDEADLKDVPKRMLTPLLLQALSEPLGGDSAYLLALSLHEKAEQAQARLARRKGKAGGEVADTWVNAVGRWPQYLERSPLPPAVLTTRLARAVSVEETTLALGFLEALLHDLRC